MARPKWWRVAPFVAGLLFFALMAALWLGGQHHTYFHIIRLWGISPFITPFDDADTVMSALTCLQGGNDVIDFNPCDPEWRQFDYSPLWLWLAVFPVTKAWLMPAGLVVDLVFFASLLLLPVGRDRRSVAILVLGVISSASLFAVERANNDLVIFALAALAAAWMLRRGWPRIVAYGALLLAGLLKYYPMLAMATAFREQPRRFWLVASVAVAITLAFCIGEWANLSRALAIIPERSPFGNPFGAVTIGAGLVQLFHLERHWRFIIQIALTLIALPLAWTIAQKQQTRAALAWLTERERTFLITGALVLCGCFFSAQNIGYRAVHLILVLPALTALRRAPVGRVMQLSSYGALLLLWGELWRHRGLWLGYQLGGLVGKGVIGMLDWIMREALWWGLMINLLALVIAYVRDSAPYRALFSHRN